MVSQVTKAAGAVERAKAKLAAVSANGSTAQKLSAAARLSSARHALRRAQEEAAK